MHRNRERQGIGEGKRDIQRWGELLVFKKKNSSFSLMIHGWRDKQTDQGPPAAPSQCPTTLLLQAGVLVCRVH